MADSRSGTTWRETGLRFYDIFIAGFCCGLLIASLILTLFWLNGQQTATDTRVKWDASTNTFYEECP